jgi:hypothetical protein
LAGGWYGTGDNGRSIGCCRFARRSPATWRRLPCGGQATGARAKGRASTAPRPWATGHGRPGFAAGLGLEVSLRPTLSLPTVSSRPSLDEPLAAQPPVKDQFGHARPRITVFVRRPSQSSK